MNPGRSYAAPASITGSGGFQGYNIKAEPRDVLSRIAAWRTFVTD